jgi:tetratricopeptide (TPR) repeat protein
MKSAFEKTTGDLAERMMAALEAGQGAGGDIRGKQSAAILVVAGDKGVPLWKGKLFDLRVEDSAEPIVELRRLLHVARTYRRMTEGDDLMTLGKVEEALVAYRDAEIMSPGNDEAIFWHAATLAAIGRVDESLPLFAKAFKINPNWRELVKRLPASDLLPADPVLMEKILSVQ